MERTQEELKKWFESVDRIISKTIGFHTTCGLCDYTYRVVKDNDIFDIDVTYDPSGALFGEMYKIIYVDPRFVSHGTQLELNL